MKTSERITSRAKVASHFGVHPSTVGDWFAMGCPNKSDGEYDVAAIANWRELHLHKNSRVLEVDEVAPTRKRELEEELLTHRAALARLKVEEAESRVVDRAEMEENLRSVAIAIRRVLLTAHEHLAPRLVGLQEREMKGIIKKYMREICERLAQI